MPTQICVVFKISKSSLKFQSGTNDAFGVGDHFLINIALPLIIEVVCVSRTEKVGYPPAPIATRDAAATSGIIDSFMIDLLGSSVQSVDNLSIRRC
jgi:hypothetical protein